MTIRLHKEVFPPDDHDAGWTRYDTFFIRWPFRSARKVGEPWLYRWHYDGRARVNICLLGFRCSFGFDYDDVYPSK